MKTVVVWALFVVLSSIHAQRDVWTWRYVREYSLDERESCGDAILFEEKKLPQFDQLIFSWNATRPLTGYFSIYLSIHYKNRWSPWMPCADWGARVQRTYASKNKRGVQFHHVRAELPPGTKADGFKVKIESRRGAPLNLVQSIMVTTCLKNELETESYIGHFKHLKRVKIDGVPAFSQMIESFDDHRRICSPTSLSMVLSFWTHKKIYPPSFAKRVFDTGLDAYGSWACNVTEVCNCTQGKLSCHVTRMHSIKELYDELDAGCPVCVSIRGPLKGQAEPYQHGHLIVVTGIDPRKGLVYVNDPAFKRIAEVPHVYPLRDFIKAWERSLRLAYLIKPTSSQLQEKNIEQPDTPHQKTGQEEADSGDSPGNE